MPHCIIEHSDALDATALLKAVFTGASQSALFEPGDTDIKVRAQAYPKPTNSISAAQSTVILFMCSLEF